MNNQDSTQENTPEHQVGKRKRTSNRGFASMSPQKQREIASKGGKAAHIKGTAHQFTTEEARAAGQKGGQASGAARAKKRVKQPMDFNYSDVEDNKISSVEVYEAENLTTQVSTVDFAYNIVSNQDMSHAGMIPHQEESNLGLSADVQTPEESPLTVDFTVV